MLYAGLIHKNKTFVTHTSLHHSQTALETFNPENLLIICILILISELTIFFFGLFTWLLTLIIFISVYYFLDLLFTGYVLFKSSSKSSEVVISNQDLKIERDWPSYSIYCPLYKETAVLPQFIKSIEQLDYPKDKLELLLLLEEDDLSTIQKANEMSLPSYCKVVIVPDSLPKTKPKAANWGLNIAQGEYSVIYDAEDMPEKDQLKKAVLAFERLEGQKVVCLQAKLNFYNPRQNILTRLFTAEYSLWFDLILPGLQSLNAPIPLGGTSNHFKTSSLHILQGWDPFNVTEDCDLGFRIFKRGFKTAVFNSTTWEEANSQYINWIRQRSRWLKGYMQTYLVHMRIWANSDNKFTLKNFIAFQILGGKIFSVFINPMLWALTILYFVMRAKLGSQIESLFPVQIFYLAVISLLFGNFLYLYYYIIGCAKRSYWDLIKYFIFVPFYWLMMSISAWMGLYQLIVKPHYWEKTQHGLHLQKEKSKTNIFSNNLGFKALFGIN